MNHRRRKPSDKLLLVKNHFIPIRLKTNPSGLVRSEEDLEKLSKLELDDLLTNGRMGVEYQPIIKTDSLEIFAFEALARFYSPTHQTIPPDLVFASLHDYPSLLFRQEYQQKIMQITNAPAEKKLFINVDQDSFFAFQGDPQDNPLLALFSKNNDLIVIELTENSKEAEAIGSEKVISILRANNISTAIDDAFKPNSLFSFDMIPLIDFIKLDRSIAKRTIKMDRCLFGYVEVMIQKARQFKKKLVLEGIETEDDLCFARELGVDYLQGFYFRERFLSYKE